MAVLPVETTYELNKLATAIQEHEVDDFEEALNALREQNQLAAISTHIDVNGRTPLIKAIKHPVGGYLDDHDIDYSDILELPVQLDTGEFGTYNDVNHFDQTIFPILGFENDDERPNPADTVTIPLRTYFTWRLLSFSEINPNIPRDHDKKHSPLHTAIKFSNDNCFRLLMDRPDINVNNAATNNITPLLTAAYHQRNDYMRELIERGSVVNARSDNFGYWAPLANKTPLDIAITRLYPETAEVLLEYGAGIGAKLGNFANFQNLVNSGCNISRKAFFRATFSFDIPVSNEGYAGIFNNCAISLPWEGNVTFPFLERYDQLQQRCLELIEIYPDQQAFRKLVTYFSAYIPTQEVIIKTHDDDGDTLDEPETKITHGTLQSLATLALATNKDEHANTINNFVDAYEERENILNDDVHNHWLRKICEEEITRLQTKIDNYEITEEIVEKLRAQNGGDEISPADISAYEEKYKEWLNKKMGINEDRLKKLKSKDDNPLVPAEEALMQANAIYMQNIEEYNMQSTTDFKNFKQTLVSFEAQLHSMSANNYLTLFNNWDYNSLMKQGIAVTVFSGIVGGGTTLVTATITFSVVAFIMPILPAITFALFIAGISVGILTGLAVLAGVGIILYAVINESAQYAGSSKYLWKALTELADIITLIPELMETDSRELFSEIIENGLSKAGLSAFIDGYRNEITNKLAQDDLGLSNNDDFSPVAAPTHNLRFYPPNRAGNVEIDEKIAVDLENRGLGLFEGLL